MTYEVLSNGYPAWRNPAAGPGCGWSGFKNHCAMRVSEALRAAGFPLSAGSYTDPLCTLNGASLATGAESLAKHLNRYWANAMKGVTKHDIQGKTGIIFFKDIKGFSPDPNRPDTGDHIDLWDGAATRSGEYFDEASSVWFWEIP